MPSAEASGQLQVKDFVVLIPLFGSVLAMTWEVGSFIPTGGFTQFSLSEHLLAAVSALPVALVIVAVLLVGAYIVIPLPREEGQGLDQPDKPAIRHHALIAAAIFVIFGLAVILAAFIFRASPLIGCGVFIVAVSAFIVGRPKPLVLML